MTQPSREELLEAIQQAIGKGFRDYGLTIDWRLRDFVAKGVADALPSSAQALPSEPVTWRWRYRITVAEGWSKWIPQDHETIGTFRKIQRHNLEAGLCELQPLYAALPASSGEVRAAALARRLCQLFDSGGESQRSVRSRHASAIFQMLNRDLPEYAAEQKRCDADPVGYLEEAERHALKSSPSSSSREVRAEAEQLWNWLEGHLQDECSFDTGNMSKAERSNLINGIFNVLSGFKSSPSAEVRSEPDDDWEERGAATELREATIEECAKVAKAHKGAARKKRQGKGKLYYGPEAMEEILAEERGEDIASEIIEREIHALKSSPSSSSREVREACALICDKHAEWAESKISEDDDPASSTSQMWACMSNTANDLAEMIRKDLPPISALKSPSAVAVQPAGEK